MTKLEPRKCEICEGVFQPRVSNSKICSSSECKRRWLNKRSQKTDYSRGKVFVLDMSKPESEWKFVEENRGG